jgi:hypothetical protein
MAIDDADGSEPGRLDGASDPAASDAAASEHGPVTVGEYT